MNLIIHWIKTKRKLQIMRSKFRFHLFLICILTLVIAGCKVKRPDGVIPESKLENLLFDYHLAKAMGDNLPYNENYKKSLYIDAVFKKYETNQAVFDSSMVWYTRNTEILSKIYERLNKRMKAQQDEINHLIAIRDKKPTMSQPGDSIDVWAWQRMIRLTGEMMSNQYTFALPADTNFKDRDTLVWEVQYQFQKPMLSDSQVAMAMQIIYDKDTLNHVESIKKSGLHQIRMYADTLGAIKEIKGFIYYPKGERQTATLLADRFSLTRYHCTDSLSAIARDSVKRVEALKADSLRKVSAAHRGTVDSLHRIDDKDAVRLTPEEMNRRRTGGVQREKKPEQIEVEQHIQQEKRERQIMQRRNQQQRRQNQR